MLSSAGAGIGYLIVTMDETRRESATGQKDSILFKDSPCHRNSQPSDVSEKFNLNLPDPLFRAARANSTAEAGASSNRSPTPHTSCDEHQDRIVMRRYQHLSRE